MKKILSGTSFVIQTRPASESRQLPLEQSWKILILSLMTWRKSLTSLNAGVHTFSGLADQVSTQRKIKELPVIYCARENLHRLLTLVLPALNRTFSEPAKTTITWPAMGVAVTCSVHENMTMIWWTEWWDLKAEVIFSALVEHSQSPKNVGSLLLLKRLYFEKKSAS